MANGSGKAVKNAVFSLTNRDRVKRHHRKAFKRSIWLNRSAQAKARYMARSGDFEHGTWWKLIYKAAGKVRYGTIGENIARRQNTPQQVVEDWHDSETHDKNIRNPKFTHMGVGFARRGNDEYWVQHFGGK